MRLLIVAALCASTGTAAADGLYLTEGFGGLTIGDELGEHTRGGPRVRLAVGAKVASRWSVEGWIAGMLPASGLESGRGTGSRLDGSPLTTYGLDVKYANPISDHFDLYLRGTISRGTFGADYAGRGLGGGAGIQVKGKVRALGFLFWPLFFAKVGPKVTGALFIDSGYEFYRLHSRGARSIDAQVTSMTFGFAVGSDF
jgi:hypothetical protein